MDYKQKDKEVRERFGPLYARMDSDKDMLNLVKYVMKDAGEKNKVPNIVNVTLNRPAVFFANVFSALGTTSEQIVVESEDKKFDTAYVEDFQRAGFGAANAKLQRQGRFQLNPFFDFQSCARGGVAARCIFQMVKGDEGKDILDPDIVPWDLRHVAYEMGVDGLAWAGYKTIKTKGQIEAETWAQEKGFTISAKEAEVLDVWDTKHNEVWVAEEKVFEQEHDFGFTPVAIQIVPLGSMLADTDSLEHQGESIFFLIRHVIPELNRLVSIMQTLNLKSVKGPIQEKTKEGRHATAREYDDVMDMGASSAVDAEGGIAPISFGDAQRSANIAYEMMNIAEKEGSLSSADLGIIGSPPASGVRAMIAGENRDQILQPRLDVKARAKELLAEMFTTQIIQIGGSVELGTRGHKRTFQTSKLDGEYETRYTYFAKSPIVDAGRFTLSAAAGDGLVSKRYKREELLQLENPDGEEKQLRWEEAERLSPAIKINRIIKDLLEMDEDFEAELLSAEMGVNLKQMLAGEVIQQPKPEREQKPKQVLPMFGGGAGGARRPTPKEEE